MTTSAAVRHSTAASALCKDVALAVSNTHNLPWSFPIGGQVRMYVKGAIGPLAVDRPSRPCRRLNAFHLRPSRILNRRARLVRVRGSNLSSLVTPSSALSEIVRAVLQVLAAIGFANV